MAKETLSPQVPVATDTGPLISAFQSGRSDLLKHYFSVLYLPFSGLEEFERHGWGSEIGKLIIDRSVVVIEDLTRREEEDASQIAYMISLASRNKEWQRHLPEAQAIVVAKRSYRGIKRILMDGKAARSVAQHSGLRVIAFLESSPKQAWIRLSVKTKPGKY